MPAKTGRIQLDVSVGTFPESYTFGTVPRKRPGLAPGRYLAVRQGDVFHAMPSMDEGSGWFLWPQTWGYVYGPVHPSMTFDDVEGATYAHDDGTHWLFAHCSPGEQIDYAASARTYAVEQLSLAIARAQVKVDMATNVVVKAGATAKVSALVSFSEAVGAAAYQAVIGATLGHYHRDPHHDHRRDLAVDAIAAVLAAWKKRALTDTAIATARGHVTTDAAAVTTALSETHTIEWRHVRAAREAAAAKAAAKKAAAEAAPSNPDA